MNSDTTKEFWKLYRDLPVQVRQQTRASYQLFVQNPRHPGLHFKCVDENSATYSVRVGMHYRALGLLEDDLITWWWIGTHGEYDRILDML
jgi:hypothetical protein